MIAIAALSHDSVSAVFVAALSLSLGGRWREGVRVNFEWRGEHERQRWMKEKSGNESENRGNMRKMSQADVAAGGGGARQAS